MVDHPTETPCTNATEPSTAPGTIHTEWFSPISDLSNPLNAEISLPVLAALCVKELNTYRRGEPYTDTYCVELLHRATVEGDQDARIWMQHCFGGVVLDWLHRHPKKAHACRLKREEQYVAEAFVRFWQATVMNHRMEFAPLAAALHYLRACLNSVILETLRTNGRPKGFSRPVQEGPGETRMEDVTSSSKLWEMLKALLANARERRLAYLLFHCGLSPREIVRGLPQEWSDVQEIVRLRRTIIERLLCHADQLGLVTHSSDTD